MPLRRSNSLISKTFSDTISLPGLSRAVQTKSIIERFFWIIVFLSTTGMFTWQIVELFLRFSSYPKKVTVEVLPMKVEFPSISVCNMRHLDIKILNSLNGAFKSNKSLIEQLDDYDNPFIRDYLRKTAVYATLFSPYQEKYPDVFQEIFSRTTYSANIDESVIETAVVKFDQFFVTSSMSGTKCEKSEYSSFFDPYYYR